MKPLNQKYRIQGALQKDTERIDQALMTKGRFIVVRAAGENIFPLQLLLQESWSF